MDELPNEVPTHPMDVKTTDTLTLFNQNKAVSRALMDLVVDGTEEDREDDAVEVYEGMIAEINKEEDEEISVLEFILRLQGQDELAEALLDKMAGVDVD